MRIRTRLCMTLSATACCFAMLLRISWIMHERWLCEREVEAAGGTARATATAEPSSAFYLLSSDRYISIPGASATIQSGRSSNRTLEETLICLGRVSRIRSLWLSLSPDLFGDTEHWTPEILIEILQSCPELQSLSLTGSLADNSVLLSLPDLCPNLVVLRIGRTHVHGQPRSPGAPEAKGISPQGLREIGRLKKLEILDCRGITLGHESVVAIAKSQSLRSINISECGLKFEDIERMLSTRADRLIVVSEYFEFTSTHASDGDAMNGTDPGLSDQFELQRDVFPSATVVTTGDWYRWRKLFGEFPDRDAWHHLDWNLLK